MALLRGSQPAGDRAGSQAGDQVAVHRRVTVQVSGKAQENLERILGRVPSAPELIRLMGLTPSEPATLYVGADGDTVTFALKDHPHVLIQGRVLYLDGDEPVLEHSHLRLDEAAPQGYGSRLFARAVATAHALGIRRIETLAQRADDAEPPYIGYYVWPLLGYDGELPEYLRERLAAAGFAKGTLGEVMADPAAREWWKRHGASVHCAFDVADPARRRHLYRYLEAKGYLEGLDRTTQLTLAKAAPGLRFEGAEELPLSGDELAVLEALWGRKPRP